MARNNVMNKAQQEKKDEFYTALEDIEFEISQHKDYVKHFEGKTVLCNCDDPEWSNFFEFFKVHFKQLKLRKLISTHYNKDGSPSYKLEWSGEKLNDDTVNMIKTELTGNGDFRSPECVELLKEADIVVTNPPFSLFREYMALLMKHNKKFIVVGRTKNIGYKEMFPLFVENKIRVGYTSNKTCIFRVPDDYEYDIKITDEINDGNHYGKVSEITWFTNMDLNKAHEPLTLNCNYYGNEKKYPKYANYDAIDCKNVKDIPKDYYGLIGVPITFMGLFCEEQFELIGCSGQIAKPMKEFASKDEYCQGGPAFYISIPEDEIKENGYKYKRLFSRVVIKRIKKEGE